MMVLRTRADRLYHGLEGCFNLNRTLDSSRAGSTFDGIGGVAIRHSTLGAGHCGEGFSGDRADSSLNTAKTKARLLS